MGRKTIDARASRPREPDARGGDGFSVASLDADRRAFLKLAGFSFASAALSACSRGVDRAAVPFLEKPESVTPGLASHYATLCGGCEAGCGLVAKVRDGRPIKLEGNESHPLSAGATCAAGQASLLGLYDDHRLRTPLLGGGSASWAQVDAMVGEHLAARRGDGSGIRLLTSTRNGPTDEAAIRAFLEAHPGARHVTYDALGLAALADAHEACHGRRIVPRYRLENARALVAVDADFLGTWLSPVSFTHAWRRARSLDAGGAGFCHHLHLESRLSITGGKADRRVRAAPEDLVRFLAALAAHLARQQGEPLPWTAEAAPLPAGLVEEAAGRLRSVPRGRGLVLCGLQDETAQRLTCFVNHLLGADDGAIEERTVDLDRPSRQALGDDRALAALREDLDADEVDTLVVAGCNPLYDLPDAKGWAEAFAKADLVVALAERLDETARAAHVVGPLPHPLETWRDAEPLAGLVTLGQPVIAPFHDSRGLAESLAAWRGAPEGARALVESAWREHVHPRTRGAGTFATFWRDARVRGWVELEAPAAPRSSFRRDAIERPPASRPPLEGGRLRVVLHDQVGQRDGRHAHNPWLHELPDPVTKVAWDNAAWLAPATARRLGIAQGDVVRIAPDDGAAPLELPALVQPGPAEDVVAVALGYGRAGTERFHGVGPAWIQARPTVAEGERVGASAARLVRWVDGHRTLDHATAHVQPTGSRRDLAVAQLWSRQDVPRPLRPALQDRRPLAQATTLAAWRRDAASGAEPAAHHHGADLWPEDHAPAGAHWGMAIDLSACTGCAACVVACQAENNVPVVGKDEMRRQRDMHWLRIDRYFEGDDDDLHVAHQPMMCQQCDHAPCETVCPVLATVHSSEGLNQQVYNRCVGTRYCSNNCPYKVRRFNWFDYPRDDPRQNLALNPDVTVRSRGVMEKCTFCVQRIQEAKAAARQEGRSLADGDIQPACMQACPAGAIVFGDTNDETSRVSGHRASSRAYRVLDELGVEPSVSYLRAVRDRDAVPGGSPGQPHGESHDG